jgi:glycosyltransferase involved in cell wall biosynthesis
VPHKNIPKLLQRCIDSIPMRDDTQLIIVDDNSDPEKVDFDHFPGLTRKHTEVYFTKDGKGAGYARNIGLAHASGRLLLFADADDYFNYCIHNILDEYKYTKHDVVFFGANSVISDTYINDNRANNKNIGIKLYAKDPEKSLEFFRYSNSSPCSKLVSKELIDNNKIKFDETRINNDTMFSVLIGFYCVNPVVDVQALYCLTRRTESLQENYDNAFKTEDNLIHCYVWTRKSVFCEEHNLPYSLRDKIYKLLYQIKIKSSKKDFDKARQVVIENGFEESDVDKGIRSWVIKYRLWIARKAIKEKIVPIIFSACAKLKYFRNCKL